MLLRSFQASLFVAMGVTSYVTDRVRAATNISLSYARPPLIALSRSIILSLFNQIKIGRLVLIDSNGTVTICGQMKLGATGGERSVYSVPQVELRVHKDTFWLRMLLFADMVCLHEVTLQRHHD